MLSRGNGPIRLQSGGFAPPPADVRVKFALRYQGGVVHEITTDGSIAVIGRDPTCDLVLNDPKSSRRHAVVESGPDGLVIRDTGSANGITVNGRKTDRAPLKVGDVFRIGDVDITVLGEHETTVVMDPPPPNTATLRPIESFPVPPASPAAPEPTAPARSMTPPRPDTGGRPVTAGRATAPSQAAWAPAPRPLTVSVLAVLWLLSIPFHIVAAVALARSWSGRDGILLSVVLVVLAASAAVMAHGLWNARSWARPVQIGLAALGILYCPFMPASIAVLVYMLRPPARRYFAHAGGDTTADQSEAIFAAALVAAVVLGGLITAGLTILARTARTGAVG
jgi:hypothetical protein